MPTGEASSQGRASVGGRVRGARERLGWTREKLAYRSDLSWSAIEQIESGRRRASRPDTLEALSRALGVTIDYLVTGGPPATMLTHQVFIYREDRAFLDATVPFLREGMERSDALLAVTTASNIAMLRDELGGGAGEVDYVEAETWYDSPVAALKAYQAFLEDKLERGATWARIVGDPGWPGRTDSEIRAWNQYESLVNMIFGPSPVTLFCTYDERTVNPGVLSAARLTHPLIVEDDRVTENPMYREPSEFVLGDS